MLKLANVRPVAGRDDAADKNSCPFQCPCVNAFDPNPISTDTSSQPADNAGQVAARLGLRETAIALIRPDGYLGFRGHADSWPALEAHLRGYLRPLT
jgi:hypothetical protein